MLRLSLNQILITTNHIFIGGVHIVPGRIGGPIGFGLPIIIRSELSLPGLIIRPSIQYNPILTMHGIFTILLMIMPLLIGGFGNILIPLMPSPSDMIFPRLNALSPRLVIDSLFFMVSAMLLDGGANAGRTSHVPLPITNYHSVDLMFSSSHTAGLSSLLGSINFIITSPKACNLSIRYSSPLSPSFPRPIFFTPISSILPPPVPAGSITTITSDRHSNTSPLDPARGGPILPSQHLLSLMFLSSIDSSRGMNILSLVSYLLVFLYLRTFCSFTYILLVGSHRLKLISFFPTGRSSIWLDLLLHPFIIYGPFLTVILFRYDLRYPIR